MNNNLEKIHNIFECKYEVFSFLKVFFYLIKNTFRLLFQLGHSSIEKLIKNGFKRKRCYKTGWFFFNYFYKHIKCLIYICI